MRTMARYGGAADAVVSLERLTQKRRGRKRGAGALVVALAALLSGCGDDDDDASAGREEYVAAADAICARIDAEGTELSEQYFGEDFSQQPSLDEQAEFLRALVAQVEAGLNDIDALSGPEEGEALLRRVFDEDPFIDGARAAIALADVGDEPGFESALGELFGEGGDPDPELAEQAREYGFSSCVPSNDGGDDDHDEE